MKIPSQKKIVKSDFDEKDQELVEQLAGIVDYNFEKLFTVMNKNITLGDNLNTLIKDIEVTVDSSGIPISSTKIPSTLTPARPSGYMLISHTNLTNSATYPTSGICISYTELNGVISINHITGLPADNKFRLRVVFFA